MPVLTPSLYNPPLLQFNGHLQTLIPGIYRKVLGVEYQRERFTLTDGDFLDFDWINRGNKRIAVLTHGLEGNSNRQYMLGMARAFSEAGWDVLAWHCRSCSEEMNLAAKLYHHGDTADIHEVVQHVAAQDYPEIVLVGFSMGANITLKYLSVRAHEVAANVARAVVFSGPCDLEAASNVLDRWDNRIYKKRFLKALSRKIRIKETQHPGRVDLSLLEKVRVWRDFDEWFSAPLCGYRDAADFYYNSSSKNFLHALRVPALLVNAQNDPILTPSCMPFEEAKNNPFFRFEMPKTGGHCGFMTAGDMYSWAERRALEWANNER
jgi:uncharacterized protein